MNFEIDNLLITGNGFDMDLGLQTSYKSFVKSDEWNRMRNKRKKENPHYSLIDFIEEASIRDEKWNDLEGTMLEYVLPNRDANFVNNVEEDKEDYAAICKTLVEYLCNLFWKPKPIVVAEHMSKSFAGQLFSDFFDPLFGPDRNVLYTFNYTPLEIIYSNVNGFPTTAEYYNVHGFISREDFLKKTYDGSSIILGIMTDKVIAPGYSFLIKSNHPNYKKILSNIEHDLIYARNVIIFGHSLNEIDFGYFLSYFKNIEINVKKERKLTIVTKDDESKKSIITNIEKMGVSYGDICNHTNVEFIHTDKKRSEKTSL